MLINKNSYYWYAFYDDRSANFGIHVLLKRGASYDGEAYA